MAAGRGTVDDVAAAAADVELIQKAVEAERAAKAHALGVVREVRARRTLTMAQLAELLNISESGLYKRLG